MVSSQTIILSYNSSFMSHLRVVVSGAAGLIGYSLSGLLVSDFNGFLQLGGWHCFWNRIC